MVVANTGINAVRSPTTKPSRMQMANLATGAREREGRTELEIE